MDPSTWIIKKLTDREYRASQREIEQAVSNMTDIIADTSFFSDATNDNNEDDANDNDVAEEKAAVVDV